MKKIIIYTTATCPFCEAAKRFLQEKGYSFEEKDVGQDEQAREEMVAKSGQWGVPVLEIDGQIIVGFRPNEIEKALRE